MDSYLNRLQSSGDLLSRRRRRLSRYIHRILAEKIEQNAGRFLSLEKQMDEWVDDIIEGRLRPYALIQKKLDHFFKEYQKT